MKKPGANTKKPKSDVKVGDLDAKENPNGGLSSTGDEAGTLKESFKRRQPGTAGNALDLNDLYAQEMAWM